MAAALLGLTGAELDGALPFRSAGEIPDGDTTGTLLLGSRQARLSGAAARAVRAVAWKGSCSTASAASC